MSDTSDAAPSHGLFSDRALGFFLFAFFVNLFARTRADADLWGHVRFGGDTVRAGAVPRVDPYSYLSGPREWINHEWLSEVIFHAAYALGGGTGLVLLKTALSLLVLAVLFRHLRWNGFSILRAGILLTAVSLAFFAFLETVRPHLFTILLFALVLIALERHARGEPRWIWGIPPAFALWANLHGGFLAGFAVLLVWAAVESLRRRLRRESLPGQLLLCVPISFAASLLNPYGIRLWEFLLRTATVERPEIIEWVPISGRSFMGAVYLVLLAVSVVAVVDRRRRLTAPEVATFVGLAISPMVAVRHLALFAVAVVVLAGRPILAAWPGRVSRGEHRSIPASPGGRRRTVADIVIVLVGIGFLITSIPFFRGVEIKAGFPIRAVELLERSGAEGNMAVHFDWGQYALWHLHPEIKVSVDGRRETVYDEEVYMQNLRFMTGSGNWDALFEGRETDLALVPADGPAANLVRLEERWVEVHADSIASVFAKRGSRALRRLSETPAPPDELDRFFP